jgi:hypothetical protein
VKKAVRASAQKGLAPDEFGYRREITPAIAGTTRVYTILSTCDGSVMRQRLRLTAL